MSVQPRAWCQPPWPAPIPTSPASASTFPRSSRYSRNLWLTAGWADRVRFQSGNFFEDPLPKADVIILGHILHDWDLDQKKLLLRKAFDAVPKGGAVIVYDAIIDDDRRENAFGLLMSLNMLIESPGGFDYTERTVRTGCARPDFQNRASCRWSARIRW